MRWGFAALMFCLSAVALADAATEAEIGRLQTQLDQLQHLQQSVYQQFQMIQELRRTEIDAQYPQVIQNSPDYAMGNSPPNYDDVVRQRAERDNRIKQYTDDLNRLYAQYQDLESQKRSLVDRLNLLVQQR
ncbi:MAG TPA: hypothetical protein VML56_03145 [Burkholderiales bacterium]|nr:hypothetical protein [Burkholderiales bacterium]